MTTPTAPKAMLSRTPPSSNAQKSVKPGSKRGTEASLSDGLSTLPPKKVSNALDHQDPDNATYMKPINSSNLNNILTPPSDTGKTHVQLTVSTHDVGFELYHCFKLLFRLGKDHQKDVFTIKGLSGENEDLKARAEATEEKLALLSSADHGHNETIKSLEAEKEKFRVQAERQRGEIAQLNRKIIDVKGKKDEAMIAEKRSFDERNHIQKEYDRLHRDYHELKKKGEGERNAQIEALQARLTHCEIELSTVCTKMMETEAERGHLENELTQSKKDAEKFNQENMILKSFLAGAYIAVDTLISQKQTANSDTTRWLENIMSTATTIREATASSVVAVEAMKKDLATGKAWLANHTETTNVRSPRKSLLEIEHGEVDADTSDHRDESSGDDLDDQSTIVVFQKDGFISIPILDVDETRCPAKTPPTMPPSPPDTPALPILTSTSKRSANMLDGLDGNGDESGSESGEVVSKPAAKKVKQVAFEGVDTY